ncbi:hypothetical protein PENSPDRAFT_671518 [Peniophora sp. CONT]|nr:hypothetical protein PENSPDRAFT_671518 [Peniophora sp. CONT]
MSMLSMKNRAIPVTTVPPELRAEIMLYVAAEDPIRVLDNRNRSDNVFDEGWMKLSHSSAIWRSTSLQLPALWADNVCAYPHVDALQTFVKRAQKVPLTVDVDLLLKGCYSKRDMTAVIWLTGDGRATLKKAKTISSTLLRDKRVWTRFNCLTTSLGPEVWPNLFAYAVYDKLTTLVYHMTPEMDFPRLIDPNIQVLEIVPCETNEMTEGSEGGIVSLYRQSPCWAVGPVMDTDTLLAWISTYHRAKSITINAITISDNPNSRARSPEMLPLLERLDLRGPRVDNLLQFAQLIQPDPFERTRIATCLGNAYTPPANALEHAGLAGKQDLEMITECSRDMRWTTMCTRNSRSMSGPVFCDGEDIPCLTAEKNTSATFYWRKDAISRANLHMIFETFDLLLGIPESNITSLVIKELSRPHEGDIVWQRQALRYDFIGELVHLREIRIEDERVAFSALCAVKSEMLENVHIVCRADWTGKSGLSEVHDIMDSFAKLWKKKVRVTVSGARRAWDEVAVDNLKNAKYYTFVDQRQVVEGIESERAAKGVWRDLQIAEQEYREAKTPGQKISKAEHAFKRMAGGRVNPFATLPPETVGRVVHYLDANSLLSASKLCRLLRGAVRVEWRMRVKEQTRKHVRDAVEFYNVLGIISGLVSGSTVLAVVAAGSRQENKDNWTEKNDLDVYVPDEGSLNTLMAFLRRTDDYEEVTMPKADKKDYWEEPACITSVTRLRSPSYDTHIDVICAQGNCATLPITAFWGTPVMNYITKDNIVILYPHATLKNVGFKNPRSDRRRVSRSAKKYAQRGFHVHSFNHNKDGCAVPNDYCPSTLRTTEDAQSLSIAWGTTEANAGMSAKSPSFRNKQFSVPPSVWRWSNCPSSRVVGSHGYLVAPL